MLNKKFELDYTPTVIYTQDNPEGIGKLYLNGVRAKGLIKIDLHGETRGLDKIVSSTLNIEVIPDVFANSLVKEETYGLDK
jgi:hypothetical protein